MDKNGKVQVIPLSKDYTEGYANIRWDSPSPADKVKIYDPFLDGPIEELMPKPVKISFVGGGMRIPAIAFSTTWDGAYGTNTESPATGVPHKEE